MLDETTRASLKKGRRERGRNNRKEETVATVLRGKTRQGGR